MTHEVTLRSGNIRLDVPYSTLTDSAAKIDRLRQRVLALAAETEVQAAEMVDAKNMVRPLAAAARLQEAAEELHDEMVRQAATVTLVPGNVIATATGMDRMTISRRTSGLDRIDAGKYRNTRPWSGHLWSVPTDLP